MGVRLYNPTTGRFLSVDPVRGGSCSYYDYVCADPVNMNDLDGRSTKFNKAEAKRCARHPVQCRDYALIPDWALREAKRYRNKGDNNAYRHCIWQAVLTWKIGANNAAAWGDAHETTPGRARDHQADVHNNAVGRSIGRPIDAFWIWTARRNACRECRKALNQGRLDRGGG
jgi:hypothetical protein